MTDVLMTIVDRTTTRVRRMSSRVLHHKLLRIMTHEHLPLLVISTQPTVDDRLVQPLMSVAEKVDSVQLVCNMDDSYKREITVTNQDLDRWR